MHRTAAGFGFASLKVLEGVDGFDFAQKLMEPCHASLGFAVGGVFNEVGDLIVADGAIADGITLEERNLYLIVAGEQERVPLFFSAFFDGQLVVRMRCVNELR
jgi:hypothetical protein